jgi:hypothetical protein
VPGFADSEVVREADYDWSAVSRPSPGSDLVEYLRLQREKWLETGICPDPGVYEVRSSNWLREIREETGYEWLDYHHYLILGHDVYVEVIAKGWRDEEVPTPG